MLVASWKMWVGMTSGRPLRQACPEVVVGETAVESRCESQRGGQQARKWPESSPCSMPTAAYRHEPPVRQEAPAPERPCEAPGP